MMTDRFRYAQVRQMIIDAMKIDRWARSRKMKS